jgi:hypothetical protein
MHLAQISVPENSWKRSSQIKFKFRSLDLKQKLLSMTAAKMQRVDFFRRRLNAVSTAKIRRFFSLYMADPARSVSNGYKPSENALKRVSERVSGAA